MVTYPNITNYNTGRPMAPCSSNSDCMDGLVCREDTKMCVFSQGSPCTYAKGCSGSCVDGICS